MRLTESCGKMGVKEQVRGHVVKRIQAPSFVVFSHRCNSLRSDIKCAILCYALYINLTAVQAEDVRFPMVSLEFFIDIILPAALWPWGRRNVWQKWAPGIFPGGGGKGGRCVGVTTLPPSCADCLEIWEPQPPGTLRACPGLYRDRKHKTSREHTSHRHYFGRNYFQNTGTQSELLAVRWVLQDLSHITCDSLPSDGWLTTAH
jgi:hypothetical protein